jgi:carbon-monoxide dehydrogenase large subunit
VVLDVDGGGSFHVAGAPAVSRGWSEVAAAVWAGVSGDGSSGDGVSGRGALRCETDCDGKPTFPFGAYIAVVDVDTETGAVRLDRLVMVDDAGRVLNPLLATGQVHGGAAQGVGQALLEEFLYDEEGNPRTVGFADYAVPSAVELPFFESSLRETPSPNNALGAKGIAESGSIGAPPAVQNAVVDALSHLGVSHIDMPCTPERVWRAINQATSA